ncbi:MAG: class I SAM-dependent methyltransferase [Candidatus Bathyarchaeota archaeon]|nr:class I SAM-dependent methyltransferase [Candidatus Bathyarchaeota archaeon]
MFTLDVGSGQMQRGDVNVDVRRVLRKPGSEFIVASSFNLPFVDNAFEKVYCCHVLEHLIDPYKSLKEIVRVCSYNAQITVPHGKHPYAHIDTDHKTFFGRSWFSKAAAHLKCGCTINLRIDTERSIFYLPVEIIVQIWKDTRNKN